MIATNKNKTIEVSGEKIGESPFLFKKFKFVKNIFLGTIFVLSLFIFFGNTKIASADYLTVSTTYVNPSEYFNVDYSIAGAYYCDLQVDNNSVYGVQYNYGTAYESLYGGDYLPGWHNIYAHCWNFSYQEISGQPGTFYVNSISGYTIYGSAGSGGSISPSSQFINTNSTGTFTVTPNGGYAINSVSGCGGSLSGNTYTTGAINSSCTVSATFSVASVPIVTTSDPSANVNTSFMIVAGNADSSSTSVTEKGFVYSTTQSVPTIANATKWACDNSYCNTAGLGYIGGPLYTTQSTYYYVRAYATNSSGTGYGSVYYQSSSRPPVLSSAPTATSVGSTTATINGNYTTLGYPVTAGYDVTGYTWGTSTGAGSLSNSVDSGTSKTTTGAFSVSATGLPACTKIYYHAMIYSLYGGRGYSPEGNFTTTGCTAAAISNGSTATSIGTTYFGVPVTVTSLGAPAVVDFGIVYGTSSGARSSQVAYTTGATSLYSETMTYTWTATACTKYYYQAYITNLSGAGGTANTTYSPELTLTTTGCASPAVAAATATSPTQTSAILGSTVSTTGTPAYYERGVVYATTPTPTTANTKVVIAGSGTTAYTQTVTLACGTTYYVRGYAINNQGGTDYTVYSTGTGTTVSTTACNVAPSVSAPTVGTLSQTGATITPNITSAGIPATLSARGTCWNTSNVSGVNCLADGGTATGSFSQARTGLTCGTSYYAFGYATNATGTTYSTGTPFSTSTCQVAQTINLTNTTGTYPTGFNLSNSGSSGTGAKTYALVSAGTAGCSVSAAGAVTFSSAGSCTANVTIAADTNYYAATSATTTITINKGTRTATLTNVTGTYPTGFNLSYTVSNGTGSPTYALVSAGTAGCSVSAAGAVTFTSAGTCTANVTIATDTSWNAATSATTTITINKGTRTATLTNVTGTYPTGFNLSYTVSNGTGSPTYALVSAGTAGCSVSAAGAVTFTSAGTCTANVTIATDTSWNAATSATTTITINKGTRTATLTNVTGTYPTGFNLSYTVSNGTGSPTYALVSAGTAGCSVSAAGAVTFTSAGTCTANVTIATDTSWNAATSATTTITINKANQVAITITSTTGTYGTPLPLVTTAGGSTAADTYFAANGTATGCAIAGTTPNFTLTSTSVGTCTVTATSPADTNYNAISSSATTITINKASRTATLANVTGTYPTGFNLSYTVSAGTGAQTYALVSAGSSVCAVSAAGAVTFSSAGTCTANVTIATDTNYLAATSATTTITINKANQVAITITSTTGTYGTPLPLVTTAGGSTAADTYFAANGTATGCAIAGTTPNFTLTSTSAGTCTVTATSPADTNYNAISSSATTITINKANQSALTLTNTSGTYGSALTVGTSGGSGTGAVTYVVTSAGTAGCSVGSTTGAVTFTAAGTCTITATKATDTNYNAISTSATTVTISSVAPLISLPTSASITTTGATLGATITSNGGVAISARGTCYSTTSGNATLALGTCLAEGGITVALFTHARTGLTSGTRYYYQGYATNGIGTSYSGEGNFYTQSVFTATPGIGTLTCNGGACAAAYNYGTVLSMSASGVAGYTVVLSSAGTSNGCVSSGGTVGTAATCTATIPAGNTGITATYTITTNNLTINRTGTGAISGTYSAPGTYAVNYGSSPVVTAAAVAGFSVAISGGCSASGATGVGATCTVTNMTGVQTVNVIYSSILTISNPNTKTIVGTNVANCSTASCTPSVAYNTSVTLAPPAVAGYTFAWGGDGTCTGSATVGATPTSCTFAMNGAKSVSATYTITTNNLTINRTGTGAISGTYSAPGTYAVNYGSSPVVTAAAVAGFSVAISGGCSASGATGVGATCTVTNMTGVQTVNVIYSSILTISNPNTKTIVGTNVANCSTASCTPSVAYNTSVTLAPPAVAGYTFAWGGDGTCTGSATVGATPTSCTFAMNGAKSVSATYTITSNILTISNPNTQTIVGTNVANCSTASCTPSVTYGTSVTLAPPAVPGYTFAWGGDGTCTGSATVGATPTSCTFAMNGAKSVSATYTSSPVTLTFDTNGGTLIDSIVQNYGTAITTPSSPTKVGNTFSSWSPVIPATMPGADLTVVAQWTPGSYTLTFDSDGGSAVSAITQNFGTAITPPASPTKSGYTFLGWMPAIPATMPGYSSTIKALWTLTSNDVNFGLNGTGSTSYSPTNIGNTATGSGSVTSGRLTATKYTTTVPLTGITIKTRGTASTNVKVGIYTHDSANNRPGTLLFTAVASAVTANTWSTISITRTYLAPGDYWIAFNCQATSCITTSATTGSTQQYKTLTYTTAFPNPGSTGWTTATTNPSIYIIGVPIKGYAKATKATLVDNNVTLKSFGFYSHATGNIRLALYSDSSGPLTKLWESNSTALTASSWNTINISAGTPTSLVLTNAGTYWISWQSDSANAGPSYTAGSAGDGNYMVQAYGTYPTTWTSGVSTSERWSIYGTYTKSIPTVTSQSWSSVTGTTVTLNANVTSLGNPGAISARGFCYGAIGIATTCVNASGTTTGSYSLGVTSLSPCKDYTYRGFATNTAGTGYSAVDTFTTSCIALPSTTTQAVSNISYTTATGNGTIVDIGGDNPNLRGIVYDTVSHAVAGNPGNVAPSSTLYPNKVEDSTGGFGAGAFTSNITGLSSSVTYYVRAYSHNSIGYSYGSEVSFTTIAAPVIKQADYQLFSNQDSKLAGTALSSQDSGIVLNRTGDAFRLRLLLGVTSSPLVQNGVNFKLQFAPKNIVCNSDFSGETYADITTDTEIAYYNNFAVENNMTVDTSTNNLTAAGSIIPQAYVKSGIFTSAAASVPSGGFGIWDFSLYQKGQASQASYCLRVVKSDGSLLNAYDFIPEVTTAQFINRRSVGSLVTEQCSDGISNGDNDVLIDIADPECHIDGLIENPYVSLWNSEATAPVTKTGGGNGGGQVGVGTCPIGAEAQCCDGISNGDNDVLIDIADPECHLDGNINNSYVSSHNSELVAPVSNTGGGQGGDGGGDLGFLFKAFKSLFNFSYLKTSMLGMVLNIFN